MVYGSKAFYALALVAVSTYVAREWGAAALGDYSVFLTLLTVASVVAVFGADMRYIETAPKVVGKVYAEEKVYATKTVLAVLGQTAVLLPLFGLVVALLVPGMFWGTFALLFMAVVTITSSILVSQNRQVLNSVLAFMLRPALFFVAIAVLAATGFGFGFSVPVSLIVSFAVVAIIAVFVVGARPRRGFELRSYFTKQWWDASWAYVVIGLYPILFSQADRLLVLQMVGARETGFYSAAQNILNIANYAVNAVMSMALPLIASRLANKLPKTDFTKRMKRLSRGLFGFAVLCTVVFVVAGDLILSVFGEGFSAASLPLVVMSIGLAGGLAFGFPITVLTLSENRRSVIPLFVGLLCASLLLSALGIYWWGILGAAMAAAVSNIASRWVFHIVCVRKTGISTAVF
ncbi:hypothetical protein AB0N64_04440 [Microbacterium sp. NPDC089318]